MGNSLKSIRRDIASINNIQKTTRAMKLVATSKLKKAEEAARRSKAYDLKLNEVFNRIMESIISSGETIKGYPLLPFEARVIKMVDIIFITADKGLCGSFNATTIKATINLMNEYKAQGIKIRLRAVGKKGISFFRFNEIELYDESQSLASNPTHENASTFIMKAVNDYISCVTDKVIIVHNGFKNMLSQELKITTLLPLDINTTIEPNQITKPLLIEPHNDKKALLAELAKKYVDYNMFYALIDSLAAELSARMQAMDTATNNAEDLVRLLTIKHNKARQAQITTELVEINAGVLAMI